VVAVVQPTVHRLLIFEDDTNIHIFCHALYVNADQNNITRQKRELRARYTVSRIRGLFVVKLKFKNDFIFNIETNSKNYYETRTKIGNAGLFVNKLQYAPLLIS